MQTSLGTLVKSFVFTSSSYRLIFLRLINLPKLRILEVVINHEEVVINLYVYIRTPIGFVKGFFGFKNKGTLCWNFDWGINFEKYVHFLSTKLKNLYCFLGARKWNEMYFGFLMLKSKLLCIVVDILMVLCECLWMLINVHDNTGCLQA